MFADLETGLTTCVVGSVVRISAEGMAIVDFPGNPGPPVLARSVLTEREDNPSGTLPKVLLVFESGDVSLPVVVGILRDALYPDEPADPICKAETVLEADRVVLNARESLELQCGNSRIELRKDGALVKAERITSTAQNCNRIKGGSVAIN